jgi:hypothetical protein
MHPPTHSSESEEEVLFTRTWQVQKCRLCRVTHTPWRDGCIMMCVCAACCRHRIHVLIAVDAPLLAGRAQFTFYAPHCTPARQGVEGGNEKRLALGDASAIMPHAMVRGFSPWAPMQRASQVYFSLYMPSMPLGAHALHTCVWVSGKLAGRPPTPRETVLAALEHNNRLHSLLQGCMETACDRVN